MIRTLGDGDAPALAQLFLEARRRTFYWVEPSRFQRDDFALQTQNEQIWVAEQAGHLCGFIAIWAEENFVHHLYVDEACHGQGLGRALLTQGLAGATQPV
ncbi:MAG TPA: GNAT family N-acetyltransferase, partial [Leclercia adecarboxylata]|nr:GNAT family N-acetyltransferase [Leclercia adecarboxylata]